MQPQRREIEFASALFLRQSFPELVVLSADERVCANAALLGLPAEIPRA